MGNMSWSKRSGKICRTSENGGDLYPAATVSEETGSGRAYEIDLGAVQRSASYSRAIAYEKSGRWFTAEEHFLRANDRTDAGSSAFRHPRSELTAPLPQEVEPAFNNRKLHMRLPWPRDTAIAVKNQPRSAQGDRI